MYNKSVWILTAEPQCVVACVSHLPGSLAVCSTTCWIRERIEMGRIVLPLKPPSSHRRGKEVSIGVLLIPLTESLVIWRDTGGHALCTRQQRRGVEEEMRSVTLSRTMKKRGMGRGERRIFARRARMKVVVCVGVRRLTRRRRRPGEELYSMI